MNRTRTYEAMLLLDNRAVKRGWQALKDNVTGLFQKHGAEIVSAKRWDERRLAYPIKHQLRGTYLLVYCKAETESVSAIQRDLEYADPVLRYLTLACDEVPETAFEPESAFDESAVRVEEERGPAPAATEEESAPAADESESTDEPKAEKASDEPKAEKASDEPKAEKASDEGADSGDDSSAEEGGSDAGSDTDSDSKEDDR